MTRPACTDRVNDIVQAYLQLGDSLRMAALPGWISADLNLSQLKAIILLEHHGAMTISELARQLGTGNPAASILVQQLVQQGLVERSEDELDRRRTFVHPLEKGVGLVASRRENIQANLLRWLDKLSEVELSSLQTGLRALVRIMQAEGAQEGMPAAPNQDPEMSSKAASI